MIKVLSYPGTSLTQEEEEMTRVTIENKKRQGRKEEDGFFQSQKQERKWSERTRPAGGLAGG